MAMPVKRSMPLDCRYSSLELAAVSSSDEAKVKVDWPTVTVVSEPKHLFNDPHLDLIVIPTPNDTHFLWRKLRWKRVNT